MGSASRRRRGRGPAARPTAAGGWRSARPRRRLRAIELNLILLAIGGFAFLYLRHRVRGARRRMLADQRGLHYSGRGLDDVSPALGNTLLFAAADGGHERDVLSGRPMIADEAIPLSIFTFQFQRELRGERPIAMVRPPFALDTTTTVITYRLPRQFGHILAKRAGDADDVPEAIIDPPRTVVAIAREASGIDRVVRVDPPAGLAGDALAVDALTGEYRVWSASAEDARRVFTADICRYLCSPAAGTGEWVIELIDDLLIVYCAADGALSEDRILAMNEFTDELCRRIMRSTAPATPRGIEHRP